MCVVEVPIKGCKKYLSILSCRSNVGNLVVGLLPLHEVNEGVMHRTG